MATITIADGFFHPITVEHDRDTISIYQGTNIVHMKKRTFTEIIRQLSEDTDNKQIKRITDDDSY